jgi:hypothetical protein
MYLVRYEADEYTPARECGTLEEAMAAAGHPDPADWLLVPGDPDRIVTDWRADFDQHPGKGHHSLRWVIDGPAILAELALLLPDGGPVPLAFSTVVDAGTGITAGATVIRRPDHATAELLAAHGLTPEDLGREVRRIWVEAVRAMIPDPKASWVASFDETDDFQRLVDIAIGVGIAERAWVPASPPSAVTAVQLTDDVEWEPLAAWAGGQLRNRPVGDSGEYETELVLPDGRVAVEGDWLIRTPGGTLITQEVTAAADPWADFGPPTVETALREMHAHFRLHRGWMPAFPTANLPRGLMDARWAMIDEEVNTELRAAIEAGDVVGIADAVADAVAVLVGLAVVCGIPFDAVFAEVMASNMTKTSVPGLSKLTKGPGYQPPRIAEILAAITGSGTV